MHVISLETNQSSFRGSIYLASSGRVTLSQFIVPRKYPWFYKILSIRGLAILVLVSWRVLESLTRRCEESL